MRQTHSEEQQPGSLKACVSSVLACWAAAGICGSEQIAECMDVQLQPRRGVLYQLVLSIWVNGVKPSNTIMAAFKFL